MRYLYTLQLYPDDEYTLPNVSQVLGVEPTRVKKSWALDLIHSDPYIDPIDPINNFLNLLEGKYEALANFGIQRSDITIWMVYEYDNQCNMEFLPKDMKRLGENGITLCVSCWDSGED